MVSLEYLSSTYCVSAGAETTLTKESPFHRELYRQNNRGVGRMQWVLRELVLTGAFGLSCKEEKGERGPSRQNSRVKLVYGECRRAAWLGLRKFGHIA